MPRAHKIAAPVRTYVRMTRWRLKRFFAALEECGTVRVAAALAGVGIGAIYRLRKGEPGFAEKMAAAKAKAAARLKDAPPPSFASGFGPTDASHRAARSAGPRPASHARSPSPAKAGEDLYAGLVVRRGMGGRLQLMSPGRPWWDPARHDGIFLLALRGTGNVTASARAAGFTRKVAYDQMKARPRFAAACEAARAQAQPRLEDLLALQSVRWSDAAYDEAFEGEPLDEHDVERAIRTLDYWERKERRRGVGPGR